MGASHVRASVSEFKTLVGIRNDVVKGVLESRKVCDDQERERGTKEDNDESCFSSTKIVPPPIESAALPELLKDNFDCKHCYSKEDCMLYKAAEINDNKNDNDNDNDNDVDVNDFPQQELLTKHTSHIPPTHLTYFTLWDTLLDLEANEANFNIVQNWLVPSLQREKETGTTASYMEWEREYVDREEERMVKFERNGVSDGMFTQHTQTTDGCSQR